MLPSYLGLARAQGASDLHLSAGYAPRIRRDGKLQLLQQGADNVLPELLLQVLDKRQQAQLERDKHYDFALELHAGERYRAHYFYQQSGLSAVFRVIPMSIPSLDELFASNGLRLAAAVDTGLVLVTGATGSGKSTTLAAILEHKNQCQQSHIVTLEDPIEFSFESKQSIISQRQYGQHYDDFNQALRAVLRADPDIIMLGELRDLETIRLALTAAETGHLVLASLHTRNASNCINRLVDVFPAVEKELVRTALADSLRAVIAQQLVAARGGGRIAVFESLLVNTAVANLIRQNQAVQLLSCIQTGAQQGMQSFQQAHEDLLQRGLLDACALCEQSV